MTAYIYKITNNITGKWYIGSRRCKCVYTDKYFGSSVLLSAAIRKHSKQNFTKIILCICDDDGYELESLVLDTIDAEKDINSYNMINDTCNNMQGKHHTKESKRKIAASKIGKPRPQHVIDASRLSKIGKKATLETKIKMSKKKQGFNNPFYGKSHTPESIAKMKESLKRLYEKRRLAREGVLS